MRRILLIVSLLIIVGPSVKAENATKAEEKDSAFQVNYDKGNVSFACFAPKPKKDLDVARCLGALEQKIRRSRSKETEDRFTNGSVICSFKLNRTGAIRELRVLRSSGTNTINETALKIIQDSAPFSLNIEDWKEIEGREILIEFGKSPKIIVSSRMTKQDTGQSAGHGGN